jgi:hypothetical protein
MFGPIIDIDKSGSALLDKKYFKLVPEFFEVFTDKNLGGKMLLYIVCVYDRKSPYRHLPYEVRKEDVSLALFGKKNYHRCKHKKVEKAIEIYKYIQYDPLVDQYQSLVNKNKEKLRVYNAMEVTPSNLEMINRNEALMQKSTEGLEKLKERINAEEEENKIMGRDGTNLSFIEERMNQFRARGSQEV